MAAGITDDENERTRREIDALLDEVAGLTDEITTTDAAQSDRRSRRAILYGRLVDLGVSQARIARACGISRMAVSLVLKDRPPADDA